MLFTFDHEIFCYSGIKFLQMVAISYFSFSIPIYCISNSLLLQ